MTDVKPAVALLLSDIAEVSLSYPETAEQLPRITLTETGNVSSVMLSGADRYSIITLQLDVFAHTAEECAELAAQANAVLAEKGLKRSFGEMLTEERYPRYCMRYRFGIDELTYRTVSL